MKLCECGCGGETPLYKAKTKYGRKGEPARYIRGHHAKGQTWRAIIDEDTVRRIRKRMTIRGQTRRKVARFYGVSEGCVGNIMLGRSWKHVV